MTRTGQVLGCLACSAYDPKPIDSGIRYCRQLKLWVWPDRGQTCIDNDGRRHHATEAAG